MHISFHLIMPFLENRKKNQMDGQINTKRTLVGCTQYRENVHGLTIDKEIPGGIGPASLVLTVAPDLRSVIGCGIEDVQVCLGAGHIDDGVVCHQALGVPVHGHWRSALTSTHGCRFRRHIHFGLGRLYFYTWRLWENHRIIHMLS